MSDTKTKERPKGRPLWKRLLGIGVEPVTEPAVERIPLLNDGPINKTSTFVSALEVRRVAQSHHYECDCEDLENQSCAVGLEHDEIKLAMDAMLSSVPHELFPVCLCKTKGGPSACISSWIAFSIQQATIGATLPLSFFDGSPQQHAILNRNLMAYFNSHQRAEETTPYDIPAAQRHLLQDLGMEQPNLDAPAAPHALHKSIEEWQMRRVGRLFLQPNNYGLISVKHSKVHLLPTAGSIQNPVFQARDITRYPGSAIAHANLSNFPVHFMHDVSSEVTPHELVEKLVAERPDGHLFVTGMNPAEILDSATTFEPSSHTIEYDLGNFNYIFAGSESESYFTSIATTLSWLRTSSVIASTGKKYHVTLVDYKLGHCVWHIYCGEAKDQDSRTFPTYSMVRIPASVSGTLRDEYIPVKLLSSALEFVRRTPDLSTRNLAAKVAQTANVLNPRTTSRERWIALHIMENLAPTKTWTYYLRKALWNSLYLLTFQWQMFSQQPDIYNYVDERKRCRTIHPTPGGGWSKTLSYRKPVSSIPNNPSLLQRLSAFTTSAFVFLLPKILVGEFITGIVIHVDYFGWIRKIWSLAEVSVERFLLTFAIVIITSLIPGHVAKVFTRLAGHFWRQLWWPAYIRDLFQMFIVEVTGGPGARFLMLLPGRGYFYQLYLWLVASYTILPGLPLMGLFPWYLGVAFNWYLLPIFVSLILLENLLGAVHYQRKPLSPTFHKYTYPDAPYFAQFAIADAKTLVKYSFHASMYHISEWSHHNLNATDCNRVGVLPYDNQTMDRVVRRLNVDTPLPNVILQVDNIPAGPVGVALAVDPNGLNYPEWLQQVERAYRNNPNAYPILTPGQHCFWEVVANFGGTPHMWYSWFMAYTNRVAEPDHIVGNVTLQEIQEFAAVSRMGLNISGLVRDIKQAQGDDRPTLNITLTRSMFLNQLHVELTPNIPDPTPVTNLARLLSTIRRLDIRWWDHFVNTFNMAAVNDGPAIQPFLVGVAGDKAMPYINVDIADAIAASLTTQPIDVNQQNGFQFDFEREYRQPWPELYLYTVRHVDQPIGNTPPGKMWQRFRTLAKSKFGSLRLRSCYPHPLATPDMKVGASKASTNRKMHNVKPEVPLWHKLSTELEQSLEQYRNIKLPPVELEYEELSYSADANAASRLIADLKAHPSVLETQGDPVVLRSLDSVVDMFTHSHSTREIKVLALLGTTGCGKTTKTIEYLRSLRPEERRQVRIVSHTESLRAQAKFKIDFPELRGYNFPTIANVITEPSTGPVIFDDAGKFWGGVLDLVILTNPLMTEVVINGDPAQTSTKIPIPGSQSEFDLSPIHCISKQVTKYATVSHRAFRLLADTLGIYTTNSNTGHITHTVAGKHEIPVLTASPRYVQVLSSYGRKAYTYSTVQGEDFKTDIEVDMTGLEGAILDSAAYVAITRSSTGVYLHMEAANPASVLYKPPTGSNLVNALVYSMRMDNTGSLRHPSSLVKCAFYHHLESVMPNLVWFSRIGSSVPSEDFQLVVPKSNNCFTDEGNLLDFDISEHKSASSAPNEHYVPEYHIWDKEHREVDTVHGQTNQFKETSYVNPHVHKRNDNGTYRLSVESRLKPSSLVENQLQMNKNPRQDMIQKYDDLVKEVPIWTYSKHLDYIDLAVEEYCSKRTLEQVKSKLRQHDPDRDGADIKITLKNQTIKKAEKMSKQKAIPGQLIHEYDIFTTLNDAAFALFLENEIITAFPENYLFYRRMSPEQFVKSYKEKWKFNNGAYSSDVTRWDVGCDAGVLNFDVHVFRKSKLPEEFIEGYIYRRLNNKSQHGIMRTMQNSGDRFTWPLNTVRRAVVTAIVCNITAQDTVAVNGDDAAVDRYCHAEYFPHSPWLFKDDNGYRVEFSGFILGGKEPEYSSEGLLYRAHILESRGQGLNNVNSQDQWVAYLDLLKWVDHDLPSSLEVAKLAHENMQPDLFRRFLPKPYRSHFEHIEFEEWSFGTLTN